jgi:N-acyl homoserine lactone hydrolase
MEKLIIHPIPLMYGDFKYAKSRMTYLNYLDEDIRLYCFIWYIEGTKGEKILIDAGSTAETVARMFPDEGNIHIQTPEEGLKKYNVSPADIDRVIVTHLHWDHIFLAHEYVNARFVVQEDELNAARNSDGEDPGYVPALYEDLNFEVVKGDVQITDGIKVLLTPGHTAGGQSVAVETEKGVAVITGFCCIRENFEPREEIRKKTPFIIPGAHINVPQSRESMMKVINTADIIVPLHGLEYVTIDKIP